MCVCLHEGPAQKCGRTVKIFQKIKKTCIKSIQILTGFFDFLYKNRLLSFKKFLPAGRISIRGWRPLLLLFRTRALRIRAPADGECYRKIFAKIQATSFFACLNLHKNFCMRFPSAGAETVGPIERAPNFSGDSLRFRFKKEVSLHGVESIKNVGCRRKNSRFSGQSYNRQKPSRKTGLKTIEFLTDAVYRR